jgi:hypothetical protein
MRNPNRIPPHIPVGEGFPPAVGGLGSDFGFRFSDLAVAS